MRRNAIAASPTMSVAGKRWREPARGRNENGCVLSAACCLLVAACRVLFDTFVRDTVQAVCKPQAASSTQHVAPKAADLACVGSDAQPGLTQGLLPTLGHSLPRGGLHGRHEPFVGLPLLGNVRLILP